MTNSGARLARIGRRDAWIVLGLLAVSVLIPLIVGAAAGTNDIPRNDDWSYRGIASRLYATGRLELDGAAEAMILGQVLLVQPLLWLSGGASWAFLVAGVLAASLTIVAGYLLVRLFLDRLAATLAVGVLVLFPAYLAYVISYMSDVPAMAAQFGCLALTAVALRRTPIDGRWLAAGLAVGCLAFSIREFALAAPVAVVVVLIAREPARPRTWLATVLVGAACGGILLVRYLLPGQLGDVAWQVNPIQILLPPAMTIALVLSPVALIAARRWSPYWRRRDVFAGMLVGWVFTLGMIRLGLFPHVIMYDLVTQWGAPAAGMLLGQRPKLFGDELWSVVAVLALVFSVILGGVIGGVAGVHLRRARADGRASLRRLGSAQGLLFVFTAFVVAGLSAFGLIGWLFDRYLWPMVPTLAALLLYVPPDLESRGSRIAELHTLRQGRPLIVQRAAMGAAATCLAILAFLSAGFLLNSNAYDGARWRAAERLVAQGFSPETTDAGPEWTDSHQTGLAVVTDPVEGLTWWQKAWPNFRLCAYVAQSEYAVPNATLISAHPDAFKLFLFAGPTAPLFYFRVAKDGCSAP